MCHKCHPIVWHSKCPVCGSELCQTRHLMNINYIQSFNLINMASYVAMMLSRICFSKGDLGRWKKFPGYLKFAQME